MVRNYPVTQFTSWNDSLNQPTPISEGSFVPERTLQWTKMKENGEVLSVFKVSAD